MSTFITKWPQRWMGMLSSIIGMYFSCIVLRNFSILQSTAVTLIFRLSRRARSTQSWRCISKHSIRIRTKVISVHRFDGSGVVNRSSKSASSTLRGSCVSKSSLRIQGLGPCASHVLMSRKQSWYHIRRRTWVSRGVNPYSEPSRCRPMHSAMRIAVPHRVECARDISLRQSGI